MVTILIIITIFRPLAVAARNPRRTRALVVSRVACLIAFAATVVFVFFFSFFSFIIIIIIIIVVVVVAVVAAYQP